LLASRSDAPAGLGYALENRIVVSQTFPELFDELGVPGLVDVIRAGNVVVANALGGGVVQSPALDAYLPAVARALFGEELDIPDISTVWCGTAWGRAEGLARIRSGIIRNAFDASPLFSRGSTARLGSDLSEAELAGFGADLERRGAGVVVHDVVPPGVAPTFEHGAFASRPMSLRVFAAWTPVGYVVMPGGLARIAADDTIRALSMQSGAASKDVWALSRGPVDTFSLLRPSTARVEIRRSGNEAPSRAMDNLFWLARYAERTENLIRVVRAVVLRLAGDTGFNSTMNAVDLAQRLLLPLEIVSEEAIDEAVAGDDARLRDEVRAIIFGTEPTGLQHLLRRVGRTAWAARDRLSLDTWRAIYALTTFDRRYEAPATFDGTGARAYLDMLVRRSAALSGLAAENMTRGNDWLFFDLGRRIERTFSVCDLVRHTLTARAQRESAVIQVALEIADSSMTYSYRYRNAFQAAPAVDLLVLDASNPRAIAYQADAIVDHTLDLPMITDVQRRNRARVLAGRLYTAMASADAFALTALNDDDHRGALCALLDEVEETTTRIADAVGDAYLQHLPRFRA
jgi:uncharacterized alpha-E superfamily protein